MKAIIAGLFFMMLAFITGVECFLLQVPWLLIPTIIFFILEIICFAIAFRNE